MASIPSGSCRDEIPGARLLESRLDIGCSEIGLAQRHVGEHRIVEEYDLLRHVADATAPAQQIDLPQGHAVDEDLAARPANAARAEGRPRSSCRRPRRR